MNTNPQDGICALCGQPMPDGEEMFLYHGYSGPCPAPVAKPSRWSRVVASIGTAIGEKMFGGDEEP